MENDNKTSVLSETLLVTFLTISGYLLLFLYEVGYASYFNIPTSLIEINLLRLILILPYSVLLLYIFDFVHTYLIKKNRDIIYPLPISCVFFIIFIFLFWIKYDLFVWPYILILLIILIIIILLFLWTSKILHRKLNEILSKDSSKAEENKNRYSFMSAFYMKYPTIVKMFFLLVFLAVLSQEFGGVVAKMEKEFSIINASPELVVLRNYSQKFICFEFDREKREIKNKYYLKTLDQISQERIQLKIEKVGPLKPYKEAERKVNEPVIKEQIK